MNKNRLRELLRVMLANTKASADVDPSSHQFLRYFLGDDSVFRIRWADGENVEMRQDPSQSIGPTLCLVDQGCDAFEDFIDELNSDSVIGTKVGMKAIEAAIGDLLRQFTVKTDATDDEINQAIRERLQSLRSLVQDWCSIVPIDNLLLDRISELIVGKVSFKPNSEPFIKSTLDRLYAIADTAPSPRDEIQQHKQTLNMLIRSTYISPTYAEVNISAEQGKVAQLVDAEVDASLNLLRCYTHLLFSEDSKTLIGLRGDVVRVMRPCVSFSGESQDSINMQSIGALQPFVLTSEKVEILKKQYGFDRLSEVFSKDGASRNSLEKAVVTSIRWLGRSVTASALPEKVLNLAAATERLILTDNDDKTETGDKQARRMSFLIATNPAESLSIYKRAKRHYALRSEVIHAGRTDISEEEVLEMETFVLKSLIAIAKRMDEWRSHDDFVIWEQEQTFASAGKHLNSAL